MSIDRSDLLDLDGSQSAFSLFTVDNSTELASFVNLGAPSATDPFSSQLSGLAPNLAVAAATPAYPTLTFEQVVNWQSLVNSFQFLSASESVNSTTSYTIQDTTSSGATLTLNVTGTGFKAQTAYIDGFIPVTVLAAGGTITGFTLTETVGSKSTQLLKGTNYNLQSIAILNAVNASASAGNAWPIFTLWDSLHTIITGTAAEIIPSLPLLTKYINIAAIEIVGASPLTATVADFNSYSKLLNLVVGGFTVSDTEANIKAALTNSTTLAALLGDITHIKHIQLTNGATTPLSLTAAQDAAAQKLLNLLEPNAIVEVHAASGAWTITGHGNNLTIQDVVGTDIITGGGTGETFSFAANWGGATIADFYKHDSGTGHDIVSLSKTAFTGGDATLIADAKVSGTAIVVTEGTNHLTLSNVNLTLTQFDTLVNSNTYFKFV